MVKSEVGLRRKAEQAKAADLVSRTQLKVFRIEIGKVDERKNLRAVRF